MTREEHDLILEEREMKRLLDIKHGVNFMANVSTVNLRPNQMWGATTKALRAERELWIIRFSFGAGDIVDYPHYGTQREAATHGKQLSRMFQAQHYRMSLIKEGDRA